MLKLKIERIDFKSVPLGRGHVAGTAKVFINGYKYFYYLSLKDKMADLWDSLFALIAESIEETKQATLAYETYKANKEADRNKTIAQLEKEALEQGVASEAILSPYM